MIGHLDVGGAFAPRLGGLHCAPSSQETCLPRQIASLGCISKEWMRFLSCKNLQEYLQCAEMHLRMVVANVRLLWMLLVWFTLFFELQPEKWQLPGTSVQAEGAQGGCWNFSLFHQLLQGTLYRGLFVCCLQQEQGSQCEHLDKATFLFTHCTSVYLCWVLILHWLLHSSFRLMT